MRYQEWSLIKANYQEELLQLEKKLQSAGFNSKSGPKMTKQVIHEPSVDVGTFGRARKSDLNSDLSQI